MFARNRKCDTDVGIEVMFMRSICSNEALIQNLGNFDSRTCGGPIGGPVLLHCAVSDDLAEQPYG